MEKIKPLWTANLKNWPIFSRCACIRDVKESFFFHLHHQSDLFLRLKPEMNFGLVFIFLSIRSCHWKFHLACWFLLQDMKTMKLYCASHEDLIRRIGELMWNLLFFCILCVMNEILEAWWSLIDRSRFERWLGSLCCVLGKDTFTLTLILSPVPVNW